MGMMQYDGDLQLPTNFLVPPPEISRTSGEYLVHAGLATFACSETQKFGHVTFFWNGNRSGYFDANLETYLEVGDAYVDVDERMSVRGVGMLLMDMSQPPAPGWLAGWLRHTQPPSAHLERVVNPTWHPVCHN